MADVAEVAKGIYRISTQSWGFPITMNQFLVVDERPALIHTGTYPLYEAVRNAIREVIDPKRLAYVVVPHFESDECGGMGRFVSEASDAVLVCSEVGAAVNLSGWDYAGTVQGALDGTVIELGAHRLRFLETPHVHHWDSMMVYEETTQSLFPADLFLQPGDQAAVVREDLGSAMCQVYREVGIFGAREPVLQTVDRVEKLSPEWIHPMHGGSLPRDVVPAYIKALREQPFEYQGKVFGRTLPT